MTINSKGGFSYCFSYNTMLKPVSLTCGHSGCRECITELVKKAKLPKCPMCRKGFQAASIGVNIALDHVTSSLAVECLSAGCGWKGGYGNAAEHFANCAKLPIPCHNIGCQIKIPRQEMPSHALLCTKRKVSCPQCKKYVSWEVYEEHRAGRCDNAVIPCPLNCGRVFPRYVHGLVRDFILAFTLCTRPLFCYHRCMRARRESKFTPHAGIDSVKWQKKGIHGKKGLGFIGVCYVVPSNQIAIVLSLINFSNG